MPKYKTRHSDGVRVDVPTGFVLRRDAAAHVKRSVSTVRRLEREHIKPKHFVQQGQTRVVIYSKDDLKKLRDLCAQQKPGRKPVLAGPSTVGKGARKR